MFSYICIVIKNESECQPQYNPDVPSAEITSRPKDTRWVTKIAWIAHQKPNGQQCQ
jgi:hypothetical protein